MIGWMRQRQEFRGSPEASLEKDIATLTNLCQYLSQEASRIGCGSAARLVEEAMAELHTLRKEVA
ncbi:hypothetical protein [Aurantimonas sp. VKM B-3413]|uniref:hypothetical protein n=1 Tax=Aurantimonas sp. VKM B-3413 TaxID=2779401 RepID=UPI001E36D26C|nr:hypothetical protein [Aurantimonas sp. VKM B-3413]MCB8837397.1 hypothetical protein [Aurantimonas sp. VKM B-3413]